MKITKSTIAVTTVIDMEVKNEFEEFYIDPIHLNDQWVLCAPTDNFENKKEIFYKGQLLEKTGEYEKALEYLDKSLDEDHTIIALNSKGNALYELGEYKKALDSYNSCITHEKDVKDDLELVTNFNYKAAFCNVELGNYDEAVKHLNKTIDMLNENGRLDKNLEEIYQKCSFEKDRLMYKNNVEDKRFSNFKFLSTKTSITALIIIIIAYIILKIIGY